MKTKLRFLAIAMLTGAIAARAQSTSNAGAPVPHWFEAEGKAWYHITGCNPGTPVEFYSQKWGGKMILATKADAQGSADISAEKSFRPAFALNLKDQNATGITGTGMVGFLEEREFLLDDVKCESHGGINTISWQGAARADIAVTFNVMKSTDGVHYTLSAGFHPLSSGESQTYEFADKAEGIVFYKIVVSAREGMRYATNPLALGGAGLITAYPTITNDVLHIRVESASADYNIINNLGQIVQHGSLAALENEIFIGALPSDIYILNVNSAKAVSCFKIIKQ